MDSITLLIPKIASLVGNCIYDVERLDLSDYLREKNKSLLSAK